VGDRAVLAAAGSVRPQHAAVGWCSQRAAACSGELDAADSSIVPLVGIL